MLFNSYEFIFIFLPITFGAYLLAAKIGGRLPILVLIFASLFFYGWWNPAFLWLLIVSIIGNYLIGRLIHHWRTRWILAIGVSANIGLLGYYKYAGFIAGMFESVAAQPFGFGNILLPLAISFFTFQQIAYLVDVYKGKNVPHSWLEYTLFVCFFPQLIAGPIVNQSEIIPQFSGRRFVKRSPSTRNLDLAIGLTIFSIGLFKKTIIADTMSTLSDPMFAMAGLGVEISFIEAWVGALAFTFQIYFDFSGYSDMAIGLARLFGIRLPLNFHSPYKASSIIEFWRRWHMTLSRFLKNYLYIPLGGNKRGFMWRYTNLMTVMLLGGLWHGAGWTFIFWGGLHGLFLIINHAWRLMADRTFEIKHDRFWMVLAWFLTFGAVVVSWVFFRAPDFEAALNVLQGMTGGGGRFLLPESYAAYLGQNLSSILTAAGVKFIWWSEFRAYHGISDIAWLAFALFVVLFLPNTQEWMRKYSPALTSSSFRIYRTSRLKEWRPTPVMAVAVSAVLLFAIFGIRGNTEFLYFQF